ncbi:hypothetical protein KUCAC02_031331 [Chaenocephalus aceratus]|uniref:Uncharacterized protein n=1 Tax=Chaenocephalus aceratus TaxID=36190 RepID=A0ACB9XMH8_CHAAC|nr:hypothetical protein KUCAC02_031331 [Chaenocephalus aceratus]
MASKQQRSGKKEQSTVPAANGGDFNMAALANQLEQHRNAISADFKATISALEAKLDCIQTTVSDHTHSINSLESNANEQDGCIQSLESMCAKLAENNTKLQAKLTDLESRSCRNNIRIIGPSKGLTPPPYFLNLWLRSLVTAFLSLHRSATLSNTPGPGQRPRPVVIRLHRFQQNDKIIHEARAKRGKLQYRGTPLQSTRIILLIVEQRKEYQEVMSELYQRGFKPALLFSARLNITLKDGARKRLSSVSEAKDFIAANRSGIGSHASSSS